MVEKMGFEKDRRLIQDWHNQPTEAIVGGKLCKFKSKLEYRYAQYLEILKHCDEIVDWEYEPQRFVFEGVERGATGYTPDFKITLRKYGMLYVEYHECKGWLTGVDVTKFRRLQELDENITLDLIMMSPDKKRVNRYKAAHKYVRQIIYMRSTFNKLGIK